MIGTFPLALTFLTIIPWPRQAPVTGEALARSMLWFPWVGAILGAALWGAWLGLVRILPGPAAAAFILTLSVWLTRGLHLDGLADTADGLLGGSTPEQSLRIMKDSRLGGLGGVALILTLLLKFALILGVTDQGQAAALLVYPVVSRWGMVVLAYLAPYARPEGGLGQAMVTGVDRNILLGATAGALILAAGLGRLPGLAALALAAGAVGLLCAYFLRRLGGITGDTLGAANEILEILALLALSVVA